MDNAERLKAIASRAQELADEEAQTEEFRKNTGGHWPRLRPEHFALAAVELAEAKML